jgi:hypothetical protein
VIRTDQWKEPSGHTVYVPTEKEPEYTFDNRGYAYWMLARQIDNKLPEGGTISEIYHNVTGPLRLTSSDTIKLVHGAKKQGYLR